MYDISSGLAISRNRSRFRPFSTPDGRHPVLGEPGSAPLPSDAEREGRGLSGDWREDALHVRLNLYLSADDAS